MPGLSGLLPLIHFSLCRSSRHWFMKQFFLCWQTNTRKHLNCWQKLLREVQFSFIWIQNKSYTLFTDGAKYALSTVLTQECTTYIDDNVMSPHHSITSVIGLFQGSKLNWAALTKQAYAIYMLVKKLSYLVDASISLLNDLLPLGIFWKRWP